MTREQMAVAVKRDLDRRVACKRADGLSVEACRDHGADEGMPEPRIWLVDSVSRDWKTDWDGNPESLFRAAAAAAAAPEATPVGIRRVTMRWPQAESERKTIAEAREKLLLSPLPDELAVTLGALTEAGSDSLYLTIRTRQSLVRENVTEVLVSATGTAATEVVLAFKAAVASLTPPPEPEPPAAASAEPAPTPAPPAEPTPWFQNPLIVVPIAVALIGAVAVIVAAIIQT